jgi:hypothetical protein
MKPVRFPHAVQLFKFSHRVLSDLRGGKINDQDLGTIVDLNPSDCSHWKKGEKSVRSVFMLEALSKELNVEMSLLADIVSGSVNCDEAYTEHTTAQAFREVRQQMSVNKPEGIIAVADRIDRFVDQLHRLVDLKVPPLYLPEVFRHFTFVKTQPLEMVDRLSRVLKNSAHQYTIQYKRGDLKAQTRMSVCLDLARIILEVERQRFPELGSFDKEWAVFERHRFTASLLVPRALLHQEIERIDARKNMSTELAGLFWVPRSLIYYQMHAMMTDRATALAERSRPEVSPVSRPAWQQL